MKGNFNKNNKGTALLMTLLILTSILVVALASANILSSGIEMNRNQSQSTKAFFAAESGVEKALWEMRRNGFDYPDSSQANVFNGSLDNGSAFIVDFESLPSKLTFVSTGEYRDVKRSIAVSFPHTCGCPAPCLQPCISQPGCVSGSAPDNAEEADGLCCSGDCYTCMDGFTWDGTSCLLGDIDAHTIDGWCYNCPELEYHESILDQGDIKEYIDSKFE